MNILTTSEEVRNEALSSYVDIFEYVKSVSGLFIRRKTNVLWNR